MHTNRSVPWQRALLVASLAASLTFALGGCTSVGGPPSTPYKGNAVWDVASARTAPSRTIRVAAAEPRVRVAQD